MVSGAGWGIRPAAREHGGVMDLEAIKEREAKATKGPWEYRERQGPVMRKEPYIGVGPYVIADAYTADSNCERRANADFIAHARQDVPDLISEVERLRAELEARKQTLDEFVKNGETETVKTLRAALRAAVDLIRTWHNLSFRGNGPMAESSWERYQESEEMREIMEALK